MPLLSRSPDVGCPLEADGSRDAANHPQKRMRVVTHSGPFHADEVFAYALLRVFLGEELELVRTRDPGIIARADLAIDVGGEYDPARGRFDHHQRAYRGPLSSAGMVLRWLEHAGKVPRSLAAQLRKDWIEYIDAVDNGRRAPLTGVPCIATIVSVLGEQAHSPHDFDARFMDAVSLCEGILRGICTRERRNEDANTAVAEAMRQAEAAGSRVLVFDRNHKWKRAYFQHDAGPAAGGASSSFAVPPVAGTRNLCGRGTRAVRLDTSDLALRFVARSAARGSPSRIVETGTGGSSSSVEAYAAPLAGP